MGIPLERGRFISEIDKRGASLNAVVSRSLANRFWPTQDPIGKRIKVDIGVQVPWMTIVGIVGDVRFQGLDAGPTLAVYQAFAQQTWRSMAFAVRTEGPPQALIPAIRREVAAIDRELPVFNITPVETMIEDSIAKPRFHALLILSFAIVALALAVIGAYGVMSYAVGQRTQEIGIRMAMGASPRDVLHMIMREGLTIVAIGCAAGLAGALACGRLIAGFLFQTAPTDFGALAAITLVLAGATLLACYLPARRATRVDPMTALRES
jgi:putative ABC transport system permease protein